MIILAQCDPDLAGKIYQRDGERTERDQKENSHSALVLELKERGYERHNDEKRHGYARDHSPEDSSVHHRGAPHQARQIGLEPLTNGIFIRNSVQDDRTVDDPLGD